MKDICDYCKDVELTHDEEYPEFSCEYCLRVLNSHIRKQEDTIPTFLFIDYVLEGVK